MPQTYEIDKAFLYKAPRKKQNFPQVSILVLTLYAASLD